MSIWNTYDKYILSVQIIRVFITEAPVPTMNSYIDFDSGGDKNSTSLCMTACQAQAAATKTTNLCFHEPWSVESSHLHTPISS